MNLLLAIGKVCGHELITGCNFQHSQAFASIHDKIKDIKKKKPSARKIRASLPKRIFNLLENAP